MRPSFRPPWLLLLAFVAAGCSSIELRTTMVNQEDLRLRRVAVSLFDTLAEAPESGKVMTDAVVHALRRRQRLEIIEAMSGAGQGERWSAKRLGKRLGADAILVGVVTRYEYGPSAQSGSASVTPVIAADLRLVSTKTGEILWATSVYAERDQRASYDGTPLVELMQEVADKVADAVDDLVAES